MNLQQRAGNTREHLVWTVGNGDPMHEVCIPHSIPRAKEQQGKSSMKYGKNERGHYKWGKSQARLDYRAKDSTIELPERCESL